MRSQGTPLLTHTYMHVRLVCKQGCQVLNVLNQVRLLLLDRHTQSILDSVNLVHIQLVLCARVCACLTAY